MNLAKIDISKVISVYSGKAGKCACGCSGKHSYASAYQKEGSRRRGYEVTSHEVSDRSVKIIVNRMNKALEAGTYLDLIAEDDMVAFEVDSRLYIVTLAN